MYWTIDLILLGMFCSWYLLPVGTELYRLVYFELDGN